MGSHIDIATQLRQARLAAGEELPALARRTGVRVENLRAIEDGRFADLPPGIYGRAAIKSFAGAFGFDGAAMLAACEPLLTPLDEPIAALARARGLRVRAIETPPAADERIPHDVDAAPFEGWRPLAAAAIDACVIGAMLVLVVAAAMTLLIVPVSALRDAGGAFALMGVLLAAAYYLCFGGVGGATVGERSVSADGRGRAGSIVTLRSVALRTVGAATEDARCIQRWGERLGRSTSAWMSDAAGEAPGRSA